MERFRETSQVSLLCLRSSSIVGLTECRKVAATALNRQAVQTYLPFIDLESTASINELFQNLLQQGANTDPNGYFQRFSLNISLTLNYGIRIQGTIQDHVLQDVVATERELGNIRGVAHCWQDYIPLLRLYPGHKRDAIRARNKRDEYILTFYRQMMERINAGTDNPCIAGNCVKDPETKLTESLFSLLLPIPQACTHVPHRRTPNNLPHNGRRRSRHPARKH